MITLHIEAPDYQTLLALAIQELNFKSPPVAAQAPEPEGTTSEASPAPSPAGVIASEPSVPALPPMPGKTRGRPRKPKPQFDTRLPGATAQPAVADNTGSEPAVNEAPAAGSASVEAAGGGTPAPAAPTLTAAAPQALGNLTAEQMRKSFGRILDKLPGPSGFEAASKILAELGYQKITEVKPEHYDAVVAATDKLLAA